MKELGLKVGQIWKTVKGDVVKIVGHREGPYHWILELEGGGRGDSCCNNGAVWHGQKSKFDLSELLKDSPPDEPEASPPEQT